MTIDFNRKNEPSTLAQKMGFSDPDLRTPKHDAIMVWLDGYVRDPSNIYEWLGTPRWVWDACAEEQRDGADRHDEKRGPRPDHPGTSLVNVVWEKPVVAPGNNFVAGFIDLYATYKMGRVSRAEKIGDYNYETRRTEKKYYWRTDFYEHHIAFEVKSKLTSIGEVVRQVRFYQSKIGVRDTAFVVVAPPIDTNLVEVLRQQNIGFLACPDMDATA